MRTSFQKYPRDEQDQLDETQLTPHTQALSKDELRSIVKRAILDANKKSSHVLLNIPEGASDADASKEYKKSGKKLYDYFKKYFNDPAATAHQCCGRHFSDVARKTLEVYLVEQEVMTVTLRNQIIEKTLVRNGYRVERHEIANAVLAELTGLHATKTGNVAAPEKLVNAFGDCCRKDRLLNSEGIFDDPYKILRVFCDIKL